MTDPVKSVAPLLPSTADRREDSGPSTAPAQSTPQPVKAAPSEEPLRLVVEPTASGDSYTYKLFDRVSGRLLIELPRHAAEQIGASPDYTAGQVFSAKA